MSQEKKPRVTITSPIGVAKFPHLNTPQTRVGDNVVDPSYNVTVLVDPDSAEAIAFVVKINYLHAKGYAEAKATSKKPLTDMGVVNMIQPDTTGKEGVPTGKLALKFKTKASVKDKQGNVWSRKPALLDKYGKVLPVDAAVFGGSVVQASATVRHTAMPTGLFYTSLQLDAVMVHNLVSSYTKTAEEYGFQVAKQEAEESTGAFGEQLPAGVAGEAAADASSDF